MLFLLAESKQRISEINARKSQGIVSTSKLCNNHFKRRVRCMISTDNSNSILFLGKNIHWLTDAFSDGNFKFLSSLSLPTPKVAQLDKEEPGQEINKPTFSCPQDGCTRVYQRHSSLEKHLFYERCVKSLERATVLDQAKEGYAARLLEGVGTIPTLPQTTSASTGATQLKEGWALKQTKKPYRFSEKQKMYLVAKFNIGQETGRKLDPDVVAKDMRRAKDSNGKRLFALTEFLTPLQVSSFFSRLAAKGRQKPVSPRAYE